MPDSASTALIGTALGGVIAGAAGWLNASAQSKRQYEKDERSTKRQAYVDFLYRVNSAHAATVSAHRELYAMLTGEGEEKHLSQARVAELTASLVHEIPELARATQAVRLAGPSRVGDIAKSRTDALYKLNNAVHVALRRLDADTVREISRLDDDYRALMENFSIIELMQFELGQHRSRLRTFLKRRKKP